MSQVDSVNLESVVYEGWQRYHAGDEGAIEDIYEDLMPFCLRVCSRTCGTYIGDSDEEASIARVSIIEAFDRYEPEKGAILVYLGRVIRNRIIDYKRSEKRKNAVPIGEIEHSQDYDYLIEDNSVEELVDQMARKQEIGQFKDLLNSFGISLIELAESSPRQTRTRNKTKEICWQIVADQQLKDYLLEKRKLPLKLLEEKGVFNRKLLDRYRRYIIAGTLIIIYDLTYLKSYLWQDKGGTNHV